MFLGDNKKYDQRWIVNVHSGYKIKIFLFNKTSFNIKHECHRDYVIGFIKLWPKDLLLSTSHIALPGK